jgi:hypothetical protein
LDPRASKRRNAPRSGWRCAIKSNGSCSSIVCRPPLKPSSVPRESKQTDATYVAVRQALGAEWEAALARVAAEQSRLTNFDQRQPALPTAA